MAGNTADKAEREAADIAEKKKEEEEQGRLPYKWTQELDSATVVVQLAPGTRGKDLLVEIKRRKLKVQVKSEKEAILEGELFDDVVVDECSWTIDGGVLTIELEKLSSHVGKPRWWPHILTHHPTINTTLIQPASTSSLSDLDGQTRGMVEKMMWDNQQKALGRPTSEERRKEEMVERFKEEHPEMDFSQAKMT